MQKRALLSAVVAATAMSFVGFAQAGVSGKAMVYTSMYPDIVDNMCKPSVAKAFPKMKVSWFQGGTENIMTKMNGEIRAKRISTDLLMVAPTPLTTSHSKNRGFSSRTKPKILTRSSSIRIRKAPGTPCAFAT